MRGRSPRNDNATEVVPGRTMRTMEALALGDAVELSTSPSRVIARAIGWQWSNVTEAAFDSTARATPWISLRRSGTSSFECIATTLPQTSADGERTAGL